MLRSVRDLERYRATSAEGVRCGRVKDVYFDDQVWSIEHLIVGLDPRQFGQKQILFFPWQVDGIEEGSETLRLGTAVERIRELPWAASVHPVCRQYASLALSSPGGNHRRRQSGLSDPHLRSMKAVRNYVLCAGGEFGGAVVDFLFDDQSWQIRYLAVEQVIEERKVNFHILPQTVERITWATERVLVRNLQPVELADEEPPLQLPVAPGATAA